MYKFYSYAMGGFALFFLANAMNYQDAVNDLQAENQILQENIRQLENSKLKVITKIKYVKESPAKKDTLAAANKNPLNVKDLGKYDKWQGQIGKDKHGHAIFSTWEHGMRAASFVLRSYAQKHGIDTVKGIVNRFAEENNEEYIAFLCKWLGVKENEKINIVKRMPEILRAMSRFECGESLPEHLFVAYDILGKI